MQFIIYICFIIQLTLAIYPEGCKTKGFYCVNDDGSDNKYFECNEYYEGIRTCPSGTKCIDNEMNRLMVPCEPIDSIQIKNLKTEDPIDSPTVVSGSDLCTQDGYFCVDDGLHDYQYLECFDTFKGFKDCAPGTKCGGVPGNPYDYNPCSNITSSSVPSETSSSTTSSSIPSETSSSTTSSSEPTTPSVETGSSSSVMSEASGSELCTQDGYFCVDDGLHDYQYLECFDTFKGFKDCAPGTKCGGVPGNPYDYNPCSNITSSSVPSETSSSTTSSSEPITPSVETGSSSSVMSEASGSELCTQDGYFCVDDGLHDYQYLDCFETVKGFKDCPVGTKCKGIPSNPYDFIPCGIYNDSSSTQESSSNSETIPTDCSVYGFFCVDDGKHDYQYLECSQFYKGFKNCAPGTKCLGAKYNPYDYNPCADVVPTNNTDISSSEEPITPSVETTSSSEIIVPEDPTTCTLDGYFCIDDGKHDYQYYVCSPTFNGYQQCAPGTKCKGSSGNPYNYNPCVISGDIPIQSSTDQSIEKSSSEPTTPSVETGSSSSEINETELCIEDGYFCIDDGKHDYQYLECFATFKGFKDCAPGTKCAGSNGNPYQFNPCIIYNDSSSTQSSTQKSNESSEEEPITPSVGISSDSMTTSSEQSKDEPIDPTSGCGDFICPSFGIFCHIDGKHNNQYCECAQTFNGSRPCAPGTWCKGEQPNPYDYNPCVFIDQTTWFGSTIHTLDDENN